MWKFNLGDKVKSMVTGQEGVTVNRSESLNMCVRYYVQPKVEKDGKVPDGCWMDEEEITLIQAEFVKVGDQSKGGPPSAIR